METKQFADSVAGAATRHEKHEEWPEMAPLRQISLV